MLKASFQGPQCVELATGEFANVPRHVVVAESESENQRKIKSNKIKINKKIVGHAVAQCRQSQVIKSTWPDQA
jgi:hypothetical protein